jgi:putative phosphoribosyl transferase
MTSRLPFSDRTHAGKVLAADLAAYAGRAGLLVLALPRGGVPVAHEVAIALDAPLDVFLVRKLGTPGQEELAMGAIASGGVRVLNEDVIRLLGLSTGDIDRMAARESREIERREREYRGARPPADIDGRTVILVDDGLATGATMRAAARAVRAQRPRELIIAVPVAARDTCESLRAEADTVVCTETPEPFQAVGLWYSDFQQTPDADVRRLLEWHPRVSGMSAP